MDKRSVLAVVLICLVITISMMVQSTFFSGETEPYDYNADTATASPEESQNTSLKSSVNLVSKNSRSEKFTYETDLFVITFDPMGASVSSMVMKDHANADGQHVDLVFKGENNNNAFLLYWGDDRNNPVNDCFDYRIEGENIVFSNDYEINGNRFTLVKTFSFKPSEYLFAVTVDVIGADGSKFSGLNFDGYAYSLAFEPQVGPSFETMSNNNYDYRRFYVQYYKDNGKLKKVQPKIKNGLYESSLNFKWMSLTSKYFTTIAIPAGNESYKFTAVQNTSAEEGSIVQLNSMYFSREASSNSTSDTMYFYCGPQLKTYLGSYYNGVDNAWGLKNLNLEEAMESGSLLGWLENVLKFLLTLLYKVIPNYGVGIILLTIILKIVLWPLSKKSMKSTAKMASLQPQLDELKARYENNPQKMNMEMTELYRREGVSPMGGCLPMLLQFPILIAFYGLLNKHFELRGAMFIPGWIPDLSVPETIVTLGFRLPLLGNQIHLLPIIYTASMIFSMKITTAKTPDASQQKSMWFMTWGMPILFFFILYSAPSGLLLYWTVQNALSILQQFYTNSHVRKDEQNKAQEKKEPEAVRKYQEKLKRLEEEKAKAQKDASKQTKKNR